MRTLATVPQDCRSSRVLLFSAFCFLVVVALASGQARKPVADKSAQLASSPTTSAASSDASKYVGAETRKTCHEEIYNSWEKTPRSMSRSFLILKKAPRYNVERGSHENSLRPSNHRGLPHLPDAQGPSLLRSVFGGTSGIGRYIILCNLS